MAIYSDVQKCAMCGANLHIIEGCSVVVCDHCDVEQTVLKVNDEKKVRTFNRANEYLFNCEFDKASGIYESIIADFPEEAEVYWRLVLCRYGIQYVDDPVTAKKIPTCNRLSYESIFDDSDYKMAIKYADAKAREVYFNNAKVIEDIRKTIIQTSVKTEPYDVFICYKEKDIDGERTEDSVIAQAVYEKLTDKGYRVFFSRITLLDIPGKVYEPYIFAALQSAKIMLAFGTDQKYFNAVWVKNEWSRFLQLMKKDEKKTFIPCFKYIDSEDFPKEFRGSGYQAVDLGRVGAIQDLVRGIEVILGKKKSEPPSTPVTPTIESLLKRIIIFWENKDWRQAINYCEKVLDIEPENGDAYYYKFLAENQILDLDEILVRNNYYDWKNDSTYKYVVMYVDENRKQKLEGFFEKYDNEHIYRKTKELMEEDEYELAIENLGKLLTINYKDSKRLYDLCNFEIMYNEAEQLVEKGLYEDALKKYNSLIKQNSHVRKLIQAINRCEKKIYDRDKRVIYNSEIENSEDYLKRSFEERCSNQYRNLINMLEERNALVLMHEGIIVIPGIMLFVSGIFTLFNGFLYWFGMIIGFIFWIVALYYVYEDDYFDYITWLFLFAWWGIGYMFVCCLDDKYLVYPFFIIVGIVLVVLGMPGKIKYSKMQIINKNLKEFECAYIKPFEENMKSELIQRFGDVSELYDEIESLPTILESLNEKI